MLKTMTSKSLIFLFLGLTGMLVSCGDDDDDPDPENEEEVITTLIMNFVPALGGDAVEMSFKDPDGDGGQGATITGGTLQLDINYTATIQLLNETEDPVEDVTIEIKEEKEDHQFFFAWDESLIDFLFEYLDDDDNANPVGLETLFRPTKVGSGNLVVILRHEPNKNASGVSDGEIDNAGGETDIQVVFPVSIVQ